MEKLRKVQQSVSASWKDNREYGAWGDRRSTTVLWREPTKGPGQLWADGEVGGTPRAAAIAVHRLDPGAVLVSPCKLVQHETCPANALLPHEVAEVGGQVVDAKGVAESACYGLPGHRGRIGHRPDWADDDRGGQRRGHGEVAGTPRPAAVGVHSLEPQPVAAVRRQRRSAEAGGG